MPEPEASFVTDTVRVSTPTSHVPSPSRPATRVGAQPLPALPSPPRNVTSLPRMAAAFAVPWCGPAAPRTYRAALALLEARAQAEAHTPTHTVGPMGGRDVSLSPSPPATVSDVATVSHAAADVPSPGVPTGVGGGIVSQEAADRAALVRQWRDGATAILRQCEQALALARMDSDLDSVLSPLVRYEAQCREALEGLEASRYAAIAEWFGAELKWLMDTRRGVVGTKGTRVTEW